MPMQQNLVVKKYYNKTGRKRSTLKNCHGLAGRITKH
jgi:hypothetical protein